MNNMNVNYSPKVSAMIADVENKVLAMEKLVASKEPATTSLHYLNPEKAMSIIRLGFEKDIELLKKTEINAKFLEGFNHRVDSIFSKLKSNKISLIEDKLIKSHEQQSKPTKPLIDLANPDKKRMIATLIDNLKWDNAIHANQEVPMLQMLRMSNVNVNLSRETRELLRDLFELTNINEELFGSDLGIKFILCVDSHPEIIPELKLFFEALSNAKKQNLDLLAEGKLPSPGLPHNQVVFQAMGKLSSKLSDFDAQDIQPISQFNHFWLQVFLGLNTQVIDDPFRSNSTRSRYDIRNEKIEQYTQQLSAELAKGKEQNPEVVHQLKSNISNLQCAMKDFDFLQVSSWSPHLNLEEIIFDGQEAIMTFGYKTMEGNWNTSDIALDLSVLELEKSSDPSKNKTRVDQISTFIYTCISEAHGSPEWMDDQHKQPAIISKELEKMDWMDDNQKDMLLRKASEFGFASIYSNMENMYKTLKIFPENA